MIESLFQECLELIRSGMPLEQVLARYPAQAAELRPILKAAILAQVIGQESQPPVAAQSLSLVKFLSSARQAKAGSSRKVRNVGLRLAYSLAGLMVIIFFAGGSALAVSAHALPGQPLYSVKLAVENTRLMLINDPRQRLVLEQSFDQERAAEVQQLINLSRSLPVNFSGSISKIDPQSMTVSGLRVIRPSGTPLAPGINVGVQVSIKGQIQQDGAINASEIQPKSYQFNGTVDSTDENGWLIDGIRVKVSSSTAIQGEPAVGSRVWVSGVVLADGSIQSLQIQAPGNPPQETGTATLQPTPTPTTPLEASETPESGDTNNPTSEATRQPPVQTKPHATSTPPAQIGPSPTHDDSDGGGAHPSATPGQPENNPTPAPTHEDS